MIGRAAWWSGRRAPVTGAMVVGVVRGRLLPVVVMALVGVVVTSVLVLPRGERVAGTPVPYCTGLRLLFDTDEDMRRAAGELRGDGRVREVRDLRTQAENHDRLTEALRAAGRHDLADASRVSGTPASLRVVEAFGVDPEAFAGQLRREHHRVNHVDVCASPPGWDDVG